MFPVDVVKARLQFQGSLITNVKRYNGPMDAFKTILKEEGIFAFFKGLPPRLLYITPSAAVSFALYEQFKKLFYQWRRENTFSFKFGDGDDDDDDNNKNKNNDLHHSNINNNNNNNNNIENNNFINDK